MRCCCQSLLSPCMRRCRAFEISFNAFNMGTLEDEMVPVKTVHGPLEDIPRACFLCLWWE
eukprot:scaffold175950_cov15-Tisochrysis_lutea.AAC.1